MYLSEELVSRAFKKLGEIGTDEGKTRLERVSALRHFFACAETLNSHSINEIDLAPNTATRSEFIQNVGKIVGIGSDNLFTPDFFHRLCKKDFNVGPNFLTTQVARSRNAKDPYPKRPAPLLILDHEKASIHPEFKENLDEKFEWEKFREAFSVWLANAIQIPENAGTKEIVDAINSGHHNRFGEKISTLLGLTVEQFEGFVDGVDQLVQLDRPDISDLTVDPSKDGSLTTEASLGFKGAGRNLLFYGAPGTGKSHIVDTLVGKINVERTVFHPDMQNSDFFGSLKPRSVGDNVRYEFTPGPFGKILKMAIKNPGDHYHLVIEELNRAPAAAVFGELFQLLDRNDDGNSTYQISFPNPESSEWMLSDDGPEIEKLYIPANLSIIATMNSADQGVYPLDTAFRRRWEQEYLPLYDDNEFPEGTLHFVNDSGAPRTMEWRFFVKALNDWLIEKVDVAEDRLLGQWFLKERELGGAVPSKILLYLWDDLLRHEDRSILFDLANLKTFGDLHTTLKQNKQIFSVPFLDHLEQVNMPKVANEANSDEINEGA